LIARGEIMTGKIADRDIGVAYCVLPECPDTDGCVALAGGVVNERLTTLGGIEGASCVEKERPKTVSRVEVAGCVAIECLVASGRVVGAGGVV
jgi:hypothetical protein